MEPGQLIFSLLSQSPAVSALVGTRIFPLRVKQGQPRPAVTYQLVSNATATIADCPGNESPSVQISIFSDSYEQTCAIARAIKRALHGYRDGQLTIDYENEIDQPYEADADCFHRVQDYALDYPPEAIAAAVALAPTITNVVFTAT